jgi:hypothetical protein
MLASNLARISSCKRNSPIENIGKITRHALERISLPPEDNNLPSQGSIFSASFLTKKSHCSRDSFLFEIGKPRYMKGKSPSLQFDLVAIRILAELGYQK